MRVCAGKITCRLPPAHATDPYINRCKQKRSKQWILPV
nr:MAG TPA: hypothetical protein [Caudoviricetes sp.]